MSGRGRGRGGRGGRGGYAPPSGARLFLMRSADECGLDSRNLRLLQDSMRPAGLYPDIFLPTPTPTPNISSSIIANGGEILRRMRNSPFYYQSTKDCTESIRYPSSTTSTSTTTKKAKVTVNQEDALQPVLACALQGQIVTELGAYVPEELVISLATSKKRKMAQQKGIKSSVDILDNLEAKERYRRQRLGSVGSETITNENDKQKINPSSVPEDEEGGNEEEGEEQEENVSDEEEDYMINYYESEGDDYDDDGGGGKENGDDAFF